MVGLALICGLGVLLAGTSARAATEPRPQGSTEADDADGYCELVEGVARSEGALLVAPELFAAFGVVNGNDAAQPGTTSLPPTLRLTAGVRYSLVGLYQGIASWQRAEAECDRYRAVSQLRRFLERHRELSSGPALRARARVLTEALPEAERLLSAARRDVEHARMSVEELHATALRVDALRALLSETTEAIDRLPAFAPPARLHELMRAQAAASDRVERIDGRLRHARAWEISVRGGYDQLFGLRDGLPFFGAIQVGFNLGGFYQPFADARARHGRARFVPAEAEGVDQRVGDVLHRLRAAHAAALRRREETRALFADLDIRLKAVEHLEGERVRRYREYLWFDWVQKKAEREYNDALATDLQASLAEGT